MPNNQVGFWIRDADSLYALKNRGFGGEIGVTRASAVPPTVYGNYRVDGPKADHALTFKLDQSVGTGQPNLVPLILSYLIPSGFEPKRK